MEKRYDAAVIGCGPAGERAAILAARNGRRVAVIEKENVVGGTTVNWGTIPSKTLRESALFVYAHTKLKLHGIRTDISKEITVADFMYRERQVHQCELELINRSLANYRLELFHAQARFIDPHHVALVGDQGQTRMVLSADVIIISVGTTPSRPPDVPFDGRCIFDSNTILNLPRMPRSMIVLGAGVIGVEYSCIFAALGIEVTLVDTRAELLPYLDREIATRLEREMRQMGTVIVHDDSYARIDVVEGEAPRVRCTTRNGNLLEADVMLYTVGRDGNSKDLGLDKIGIEPTPRGLIEVNESYQTAQPHIYAVGDIIGYPALASTSMEQGRRAIRHAFDLPGVKERTEVPLPYAIYSIPEVSYIGETEEALKEKCVDYVVGRGLYAMNPRGQIMGDTGGVLKLLFDAESMTLLGAHLVGSNASELIHIGQAFLKAGTTAEEILETLFNYPTLSDTYRHAAVEALGAKMGRREA
jgi:NAD(P) transhydrogenase